MEDLNLEEQLDEKTKLVISQMEKELENKDKALASKEEEIKNLKNELAFFKNQILNKNKKMFGKSSEQINSKLTVIGSKTTKEILKYKPGELYIEEHVIYSYACKSCEETDGEANIISTKAPNTLLHKSMVSNEVLSHVINMKYQYAMPLYRQETYFDMLGASLSRQTLSNWIPGAAKEFQPVYDLVIEPS